MNYENVLYEKSGRISRVILNRPEKLNALSVPLLNELEAALQEAERDPEVSVIIIKGAGRCFSAGYDIAPSEPGYFGSMSILDDVVRLQEQDRKITAIWNLRKPVIAQVHGYCVAGGNDIAGRGSSI